MKRINFPKVIVFLAAIFFLSSAVIIYAQTKSDNNNKHKMNCPMMGKMADKGKSHEECPLMKKIKSETSEKKDDMSNHPNHDKMVMENGEKAMGFSQTATTHHFLLIKDGGAIQVEANEKSDTVNRDKIRTHLREIAQMFQKGIFTTPFAVHGQVPPGVPEMDKLKNEIRYTFEETEQGARVRIKTESQWALKAIHRFIRFQIVDHKTGDPQTLKN